MGILYKYISLGLSQTLYLSLHVVPFPSINNVMLGPTRAENVKIFFCAGLLKGANTWQQNIPGLQFQKSRDFGWLQIPGSRDFRDPARACQAPSLLIIRSPAAPHFLEPIKKFRRNIEHLSMSPLSISISQFSSFQTGEYRTWRACQKRAYCSMDRSFPAFFRNWCLSLLNIDIG